MSLVDGGRVSKERLLEDVETVLADFMLARDACWNTASGERHERLDIYDSVIARLYQLYIKHGGSGLKEPNRRRRAG